VSVPARSFSRPNLGEPVFVGARSAPTPPKLHAVATFMVAAEMKAKVASLTGYEHPAFDHYADVLGKYDPVSGRRTVERPSLVGVFFMRQIAASLATVVVRRERFLDDGERLVFGGVDLDASPSDDGLARALGDIYERWLGATPSADAAATLATQFRAAEARGGVGAAYEHILGVFLQHGGLYYY
jgi:hypothetical protein